MHPIAVALSRANFREIRVPHLVGLFGDWNAGFFIGVCAFEQAQLDFRRVLREQ